MNSPVLSQKKLRQLLGPDMHENDYQFVDLNVHDTLSLPEALDQRAAVFAGPGEDQVRDPSFLQQPLDQGEHRPLAEAQGDVLEQPARRGLAGGDLLGSGVDHAGLEAAGEEFQTAVAPAMAQQLGMTPEEFGAMVQSQYPAVAQGMEALPEITATFSGLIDTLDSQRELFESADAIPTDDLPATTVPWIITISGLLAIAAGVMLFMPGRVWAILAAVLGAVSNDWPRTCTASPHSLPSAFSLSRTASR